MTLEVCVPASTSNLGAGFDCFGLALRLYLTVRATLSSPSASPLRIRSLGEGAGSALPNTDQNLIVRAMQVVAERGGFSLPPVHLSVRNEIPLGRGLGSSAAAIVAGLTLGGAIGEAPLSNDVMLRYAHELEGHADNVAASLLGGWVTTGVKEDGEVLVAKRHWPDDIKILVVSPDVPLETARARAALPSLVTREDAVHNLQRAALLGAALDAGDDDLIWESMQDRLHQPHRQALVPGLAEALATPRRNGLVGIALSGAGPSVLALARSHFDEIGEAISGRFRNKGVDAKVRLLEVDDEGRRIKVREPAINTSALS